MVVNLMKRSDLKNLIILRDKINNLEGVKCGMAHERIAFDSLTKLPIPNPVEDYSFKRINLCSRKIRQTRLACGHTDVRNFLRSFILSLNNFTEFDKSEIQILYEKINKTDINICSLDHQKGDAELQYATQLDKIYKSNNSEKEAGLIIKKDLQKEKTKIKELETRHSGYVDDMIELKNQILNTVNKVIEKESRKLKHKILFGFG